MAKIVAIGGITPPLTLDLIGEDFMRDRVKCMLTEDGSVTYGVFSRNPYILHGVHYV